MKKGNLLIVDDEPLLVQGLRYNLDALADQIYAASNGLEGLDVIKTNEIHCILCDISMPVMNGVEFIKRIREEEITVPFIFYTGHGSHDLMLEAVKYGAFDFLNKPQMVGMNESVARGLRKGLGQDEESVESQDFMSEFKKLMNQN